MLISCWKQEFLYHYQKSWVLNLILKTFSIWDNLQGNIRIFRSSQERIYYWSIISRDSKESKVCLAKLRVSLAKYTLFLSLWPIRTISVSYSYFFEKNHVKHIYSYHEIYRSQTVTFVISELRQCYNMYIFYPFKKKKAGGKRERTVLNVTVCY